MTKRVVIFGGDRTLLETRRDVLEANGIPAETRLIGEVSPHPVISPDTSMLVACSSLNPDARRAIVDSAHSADPRVPCLVVEPTSGAPTSTAHADAILQAFDGPQKFVSRIRDLISR